MPRHLIVGDTAVDLGLTGSNKQVYFNNSGTAAGASGLTYDPGTTTTTATTLNLTNPLTTAYGGTGLASFTQGDLLYFNTGTTLSKLAKDTNATRYLSNTGTSNNPAWAQVSLTTGISGVLPIANGGTNASSQTTNGIAYFDGTRITSGSTVSFDGTQVLSSVHTAVNVTTTSTSVSQSGIQAGATINPSGVSSARIWGLFFGANGTGSNNITDGWALNGLEGNAGYSGSATCGGANGGLMYCYNNGTGPLTDCRGLNLIGMTDNAGSGGHMTNVYWLDIATWAPAFSANSQKRIGIQIGAMADPGGFTSCTSVAISITGTSGTARDGILFGSDSNLYRLAASSLKTDGALTLGTTLTVGTSASVGTSLSVGTTATVTTSVITPLHTATANMTCKPSSNPSGAGFTHTVQSGISASLSGADGGDLFLIASAANAGKHNGGNVKVNAGLKAGAGTTGSILFYKSDGSTKVQEINDTGVGFFATAPVAQQTMGAATAGATYTATEQAMLQAVYNAVRAFGLGT
jgi:hypothetical protein